jgi:MFS transporter, FHS family, glucose/mannose:H+ symporter
MASSRFHWTRSYGVLYAGFLLNGMGVVLIGPLLPRLGHVWTLADPQKGALLAAQFFGSSLGTILVPRRRRPGILTGSFCSWLGMSATAWLLTVPIGTKSVVVLACIFLTLYGFGLGQGMTAINLAAGQRIDGRAGRLSLGNALWSVGAILSPLMVGCLLRVLSPVRFLLCFAGAFLLFALSSEAFVVRPAAAARHALPPTAQASHVSLSLLSMFASLLFFYGGAETCFSGWLTTLAYRSAGAGEAVSTLCTSAFWVGIAGGRVVGAAALGRHPERKSMRLLLIAASLCGLGFLFSSSVLSISIFAAACGIFLGPVFPAALASLLSARPSTRQCGFALAACGAGASAMPLLLSLIAQRISSLRIALLLPSFCLILMLALVRSLPTAPTSQDDGALST